MEIKKNKLVITEKEGVICYGYFQDGVPTELYCEPKEQQSILGNIYAARVERVAEGIHGAFLEIGDNQKCYYSLSAEQPVKLSPGHEDKLYGGDIILVQITKDAVKTKLPVGTGNISLDGKYFVFTLTDKRTGISKKIRNTVERERLETLLKKYTREEYGIIVRTNAAGVSEETLTKELELLQLRYEELMRKAKIAAGKTLLYREPPHYITLGKELPAKALDEILTDHAEVFTELKETSVYKGYKQDKIEMRGDRAEMSDFPLYLNTVAGGLDRRDQTIGGFSFVVKIYAVPVVEIIG